MTINSSFTPKQNLDRYSVYVSRILIVHLIKYTIVAKGDEGFSKPFFSNFTFLQ